VEETPDTVWPPRGRFAVSPAGQRNTRKTHSFRKDARSCRGSVMLSLGVKSALVVAPAFASNSPRLDTSKR
jgi:hypothetical protein